jgi:photosystem II stability/assembly factor-like uncharacterized protein
MQLRLLAVTLVANVALLIYTMPARAVGWTLTEVDTSPYTGAENAIYAPDLNTIYIAYKQFLSPPTSDWTPAAVKLAKSSDGGATWNLSFIDLDAPQIGDLLEQSVSINGINDTLYVAYYVEPSGLFASHQLRVAKSSDAGASWTISTLVNGFAGQFSATKVIDENNAYITFSGEGGASGFYVAQTHDGGTSWTGRLIESGLGNGWYTSIDGTDSQTLFCSYYNGLYPDHLDLNFGRTFDSFATVNLQTVEHVSGSYVGLGSAVVAVDANTLYMSYELFSGGISRVKLAASTDGGTTWTLSFVEPDFGGVNTAVKAFSSGAVYVSYWSYPPSVKLAKSTDSGATWSRYAVPESARVDIFLDLAVPQEGVAYLTYMTTDRRLLLATFDESADSRAENHAKSVAASLEPVARRRTGVTH